MTRSASLAARPAGAAEGHAWPQWIFDVVLTVLFVGPLLSPLFRATGQPFLDATGLLARDVLTLYICPTPAQSYMLLDFPMAVCARCWGATIGLWVARLLLPMVLTRGDGLAEIAWRFRALAWPARLLVCLVPFLLWPLEIVGTSQGWWYAPLWLLVLNGAQAGLAAGVFFLSVWPGFWPDQRAGNLSPAHPGVRHHPLEQTAEA